LGDVVEDGDLVSRVAVLVVLDHHAERDPDRRAVLAQVALLDPHVVDLAALHPRALLVDDVEVFRMRDLPAGHADQLVLRTAEDLAQAAIHADELAVESDVRHPRAGELEGAAIALLALA